MPEVLRNGTVSVGAATSTEVAIEQSGCQRSVISITNLEAGGGNTCYLSFGQEAAANKGFPLQPGQTYIESIDAGYKPTNQQINAYSAGAMSLAVHERILVRSR